MQIKDLSMSFGTQVLYQDVNLFIPDDEKIGIVGVNGAGKTTLFKIMMNALSPDTGKIIFKNNSRIELLPQVIQDEVLSMDISVFDYLMEARPIEKLEKQLQKTYEKLAKEPMEKHEKLYAKINKIQKMLDYYEVYEADSILLKIIDGMHIDSVLLDKKLSEISGGEKSKIAFARLLYAKPEIILLDEPTNHLDVSTREYVTNYLKHYSGMVFIISHDVPFLDEVTSKTLLLDKKTKSMKLYNGNYSKFKKLYEEEEKALLTKAEHMKEEEERLRGFITKYSSASGKRKKMVQDREKKLEKLMDKKIEVGPNLKNVKIDMDIESDGSKVPLLIEDLFFKYDKESKKHIIKKLNLELSVGERFLVLGENGAGKSTLLKLIMGFLKPDRGIIKIGKNTTIAYYAQEHELLDNEKTILENLMDLGLTEKEIRNVLGRFLFYEDDVFKKVKILSPGERSRVSLARLSLLKANFLLLDEPTNHLDPETQEIIARAFKEYKGTMLVVSHNVEFIDHIGIERTLLLPSGKISYYDKSVALYYEKLNKEENK